MKILRNDSMKAENQTLILPNTKQGMDISTMIFSSDKKCIVSRSE
jgi:hypothetical protein